MIRFSRIFWLALFLLYPAVVATSAAEVIFENAKTIDGFETIFEQGRTQEILFEDRMPRLGRIKDPRAITSMLESLTERENWIRPLSSRHSVPTALTYVISFPGKYAIPPLIAGLDHENERVRMGAAVPLAYLQFPEVTAKPAVEALIEPLEDPNAEVRGYTALSHGRVKDE